MKRTSRRTAALALPVLLGTTLLAACGADSDDGGDRNAAENDTVTLVTHNSFEVSEEVLALFTEQTGHEVRVLRADDGGVMVNQAVLSAGNPQGDVLFGVDNTLLTRALDADVFAPHRAEGLDAVPEEFQLDAGEWRVTPVDHGDICVNYDRAWFDEAGIEPPQDLADLTDADYRDLLVVQNAASSTPGLGFLLGTVAEFGEDGWQDYWRQLSDNGVRVVDGWEQAYYEDFSGSSGEGDRPLVVSYASSPPAEVLYGPDPDVEEAPTGVSTGTCFRQIEFAGLLEGAENPEGGAALLDFMLSLDFQQDVPLQMFVHPVREDAELPELFTRHGAVVDAPLTLDADAVTENRSDWVDEWTNLVVR
ncbi:thiamine ABC transporter substrate-binding protein [Streptomyces lonarensis]|uniref:Thiamine ABC transporter substrate-binding protein n=1 Tax=Streptomyces lonarensis TaxID=700599 RepID=A0A7X6CZH1_9ACTN|nr:thiamine ABC transporter substrate-binding protein [Streptomyces lonarensis]NJQ05299.1 thiamine ABC transporter substrate-binding protein [Streptomyces lonarensis]